MVRIKLHSKVVEGGMVGRGGEDLLSKKSLCFISVCTVISITLSYSLKVNSKVSYRQFIMVAKADIKTARKPKKKSVAGIYDTNCVFPLNLFPQQ